MGAAACPCVCIWRARECVCGVCEPSACGPVSLWACGQPHLPQRLIQLRAAWRWGGGDWGVERASSGSPSVTAGITRQRRSVRPTAASAPPTPLRCTRASSLLTAHPPRPAPQDSAFHSLETHPPPLSTGLPPPPPPHASSPPRPPAPPPRPAAGPAPHRSWRRPWGRRDTRWRVVEAHNRVLDARHACSHTAGWLHTHGATSCLCRSSPATPLHRAPPPRPHRATSSMLWLSSKMSTSPLTSSCRLARIWRVCERGGIEGGVALPGAMALMGGGPDA
jgi:hypothetical protein